MYITSYCMYVCIMWFTHEKKYSIQIKYYITICSLLATLFSHTRDLSKIYSYINNNKVGSLYS